MFQRRLGRRIGIVGTEEVDAAQQAFNDVKGFFAQLNERFVISDQVPAYPIKSKNTLAKIIGQIQREFPAPISVPQAQADLIRAQDAAEIMYAKGGNVNVTYGMIYDEVVQVLKNFISYDGKPPVAGGNAGTPGANNTNPKPPTPEKSSNMMLMGAAILGGFMLMGMGKPKGRRSNRR